MMRKSSLESFGKVLVREVKTGKVTTLEHALTLVFEEEYRDLPGSLVELTERIEEP